MRHEPSPHPWHCCHRRLASSPCDCAGAVRFPTHGRSHRRHAPDRLASAALALSQETPAPYNPLRHAEAVELLCGRPRQTYNPPLDPKHRLAVGELTKGIALAQGYYEPPAAQPEDRGLRAYDPYGNIATGYTGTVGFKSSDPTATLPRSYTYTAADNGHGPPSSRPAAMAAGHLLRKGVHTFSGLAPAVWVCGSGEGVVTLAEESDNPRESYRRPLWAPS